MRCVKPKVVFASLSPEQEKEEEKKFNISSLKFWGILEDFFVEEQFDFGKNKQRKQKKSS